MAAKPKLLTRKSFFVDAEALRRAKRVLGAKTDSDAIRRALVLITENEEHWRFLKKTAGTLKPGSFKSR